MKHLKFACQCTGVFALIIGVVIGIANLIIYLNEVFGQAYVFLLAILLITFLTTLVISWLTDK